MAKLSEAGVAAVVAVLTTSCASPDPRLAQERVVSLEPFAESRSPYSQLRRIALVSDSVACVVDGYQVEVYCADPMDRLWKFGRKGEGPGEFRGSPLLRRGPEGTIAAFDLGLRRVSVFRTGRVSGTTFMSSVPMPRIIPATPLSSLVEGTYYNREDGRRYQAEVEVGTGRIGWERFFSPELVECTDGVVPDPTTLGNGHPIPSGELVFVTCQGQKVVWFENRDDSLPSAVAASPTFTVTYPSESEVATYIEGARAMTGGVVEPSRAQVAEFRRKPKPWSQATGHTVDKQGWFWVATTRDREEFSYIDVYGDHTYIGTVRVRHSMVAFDRLGSTLAVLVNRPLENDDPGGVPRRGIDWYDVSGLESTWGEAISDLVNGQS